jgi:hypothetical protein
MMTVKITKCPPMPAHGTPRDEFAFGIRRPLPVAAHSNGDGSFSSTGLSYGDASRMNIQQRKTTGERRKSTPAWALNDELTQEVIARYVEVRSGLRFPHSGTPRERIVRAEARLAAKDAGRLTTLTKMNEEYITSDSPKRRAQLERQLLTLDTSRRIDRTPAALVAGIIYLYYRGACDSVGVGSEIGIKPTAVRQILFRLNACANGLNGKGLPSKRKNLTCGCDECKTTNAATPAEPATTREKKERTCPCGAPAPARCKYCEACYVKSLKPRHCQVCGALRPKNRRTLCGSKKCRRESNKKYDRAYYKRNAEKKKAAKKARVFCSPVCKEVAQHAPVVVEVMSSFGVSAEEAQRSSMGDQSYETYLAFALRSDVPPMTEERWAILR